MFFQVTVFRGDIIVFIQPLICGETRKFTGLTYQKFAKFVSQFEQEGDFNQILHKIIVKAFFINTTNENFLNRTLMPNMLFSCHNSY